jgi:carboxymethylenebutenolidase
VQETVSYLATDKSVHGYLCRPAGTGPWPAVLLIHDTMGLTEGIKDETFRLAREGYVALAVDLYRGQTAKTVKDAERLARELPKERALHDLKEALDYLSERDEVRPEQVVEPNERLKVLGVVGLGMGGTYAFEAALADPRLRALVTCYGRLPTDAKRLDKLKAPVFGIFAGKDKNITPEKITQFIKTMNDAGKPISALRSYGDCPYGFLDPAYWPTYGKPPEKDVEDALWLIARYLDRTLM